MRLLTTLILAGTIGLVPMSPATAKTKHAPLPEVILKAKTVCIVNLTGVAEASDKAFDQLTKWGRYKLLTKREDADLVIVLSLETYTSQLLSDSRTTGGVDGYERARGITHTTGSSIAITRGIVTMTVVDQHGDPLWTDSRRTHAFGSATRELVDELRHRVEEQERPEVPLPK